jgi:hypothetical protein
VRTPPGRCMPAVLTERGKLPAQLGGKFAVALLTRRVGFPGLRWKASRTVLTASASTEGLRVPFLYWTLYCTQSSLDGLPSVFQAVTSLHLNR